MLQARPVEWDEVAFAELERLAAELPRAAARALVARDASRSSSRPFRALGSPVAGRWAQCEGKLDLRGCLRGLLGSLRHLGE